MKKDKIRIGAIVLARLDSSRLPGKGLMLLDGKPMLSYVIERCRAAKGINNVVLATSDRSVDDPLEEFAATIGTGIYRGSVDDVAGRVLGCARDFNLDTFARVNGDSPLMDFELLSRAVSLFKGNEHDIVTNVYPRSYPVGISVEVFSTEIFAEGYTKMERPEHFEHVTLFFYNYPELFSICNIDRKQGSLEKVHLAVDTPEDFSRIKRLMGAMEDDHLAYTGEKLFRLYDQVIANRKKR